MLVAQKEYSLLYVQNGSLSNKKLYIDYVVFKGDSYVRRKKER